MFIGFVYAALPMSTSKDDFAGLSLGRRVWRAPSVVRRYLDGGAAWFLTALFASTLFFLTENGNIFVENIWVALLFGACISLVRFRETADEKYLLLLVLLSATSLTSAGRGADPGASSVRDR